MKTQVWKTLIRKSIGLGAFLLVSGLVIAQEEPKGVARVSYLGEWNNKLLFEVNYTGSKSALEVDIRDKEGVSFYSGRFKTEHLKKQFALEKEGMEDNTITFILSSGNNEQKESFVINKTIRVSENISVVKQGAAVAKH